MSDIRGKILNYIFPHVIESIYKVNISDSPCKFIIKGGASVKYHLEQNNMDATDITYDIDITPLFFPKSVESYTTDDTYIRSALRYNNILYEIIEINLKHRSTIDNASLEIMRKEQNGLITMQIKMGDSDFHNMIDLSYIDPCDDDSIFLTVLKTKYRSFSDFVRDFMLLQTKLNVSNMFSSIQSEFCVARYSHNKYKMYIDSISTLKNKHIEIVKYEDVLKEDLLEIQKKLDILVTDELTVIFDDDMDAEKLESIYSQKREFESQKQGIEFELTTSNHFKTIIEYELSDEYLSKINNKIERFIKKCKLLTSIGAIPESC